MFNKFKAVAAPSTPAILLLITAISSKNPLYHWLSKWVCLFFNYKEKNTSHTPCLPNEIALKCLKFQNIKHFLQRAIYFLQKATKKSVIIKFFSINMATCIFSKFHKLAVFQVYIQSQVSVLLSLFPIYITESK